jgi:thiamine-phosphate diphosphorylase
MAARADAVQLGARSLPIRAARAMTDLTIGYSAHSAAEAAGAERDGADFVFAGSIYATPSHPDITPAGLGLLEATVAACGIPVVAIGGMTHERVAGVLKTGAHGVALISAVWHAADPVQAAGQFAKLLEL